MKALLEKYREIIVYLIVGVLTTIFCWVVAWALTFVLDTTVSIQNAIINSLSWVAGVLFAFPLNRKWVFKSENPHVMKEFIGFAGSRVSTWALDVLIMWLFVNVWPLTKLVTWLCGLVGMEVNDGNIDKLNYWFAKIFISAVLVTIANYVFSKVFIFKKKDSDEAQESDTKED